MSNIVYFKYAKRVDLNVLIASMIISELRDMLVSLS